MYGFIRKTFRWCYRNFYSKKQNDKKHSTTRIRILMQGEIKAPSTLIRFQTKTELFCPGYGYRPHYNAENDHRKRGHSKTLSRVERFLKTLFSSVDGENDVIWKRAPDHSTVSIQNGRQTLLCGFNFAGRYLEMRMRRVHLSMRTEGIKAFSKRIRHGSVDGWKR